VFIVNYRAGSFVSVADRIWIFRIQGEVMRLYELRDNLTNPKSFEERDQLKVDPDTRAENDGLGGRANGVLDFVWPDIFDRL
jgi:hypothetical protein